MQNSKASNHPLMTFAIVTIMRAKSSTWTKYLNCTYPESKLRWCRSSYHSSHTCITLQHTQRYSIIASLSASISSIKSPTQCTQGNLAWPGFNPSVQLLGHCKKHPQFLHGCFAEIYSSFTLQRQRCVWDVNVYVTTQTLSDSLGHGSFIKSKHVVASV